MKGSGHGKKRSQHSPSKTSSSPKRTSKVQKRSLSTKPHSKSSGNTGQGSQLSQLPALDAQQQREFTRMISPSLPTAKVLLATTATTTTTPHTTSRASISSVAAPTPQWRKLMVQKGQLFNEHKTSVHQLPLAMTPSTTPAINTNTQKRQFVTQNRTRLGQNVSQGHVMELKSDQKGQFLTPPTQKGISKRRFSQSGAGISPAYGEDSSVPSVTYPWTQEEQLETKKELAKIESISKSVTAMSQFLNGEKTIEDLMTLYGSFVDVSPHFVFDHDSPFSEAVQRNFLYQAMPKSLRKNKKCKELPADFDRANFVSMNIERFHTDTFPSDEDILHVFNQALVHEEVQQFFSDLVIEEFAKTYNLEFIGSSPELQRAIRQRISRSQSASRPLRAPQRELKLLPQQMEALDSLLGFTLPKLSDEHNNQILIAHLKKKAHNLLLDYNSDPFHRQSIRRRQELEIAETQLQTHQAQLDAEVKRYEEKKGQNPEEDLKRQELIIKRRNILDQLQNDISGEKKHQKRIATVGQETLNTIKALPSSITASNLSQVTDILKDRAPLVNAPGVTEQAQRADAIKKRQNLSKRPEWMKKLFNHYELTKPRISQMVAVTAMWGYWSVGNPTNFADLALLTTGTVALSSSASIINQIRETDVDAKMTRTMGRPLVTKAISVESAKKQAIGYAAAGAALLAPLTTIVPVLGLTNIALYGGLYTSLKRTTPLNTEIGAVVGAIPPMMGYFAALGAGQAWDTNLTALCFPAAMMIAWQIQHVMLICARRGEEYNRSGLVMQCKDDPGLKTTINKGIAWSVISTVVSSIPFFTGHADLTQLFATYCWAVYTVPYAMAMKKQDNKKLGQVLLAGYVVLGLTILFSLNAQVPADTWGYLFTDGPATPSPLPEVAPTLTEVLFQGAGQVGKGAVETLQTLPERDVVEAVTPAAANVNVASQGGNVKMASMADVMHSNKGALTKLTERLLNMNNAEQSSQNDV